MQCYFNIWLSCQYVGSCAAQLPVVILQVNAFQINVNVAFMATVALHLRSAFSLQYCNLTTRERRIDYSDVC